MIKAHRLRSAANALLTVGSVINLQATADASLSGGTYPLISVALNVDGASIGSVLFDPAHPTEPYAIAWTVTPGAHTYSATATYDVGGGQTAAVTSPVVAAFSPVLTVANVTSGWQPNPAVVGDVISGGVSATITSGIDSDGTGPTYVTYGWTTFGTWMSSDGGAPTTFAPYTVGRSIGWLNGESQTRFNAVFADPGCYILKVICVASVHDSSSGDVIGTVSAPGYIGGNATDLPSGGVTPNVRLRAHLSGSGGYIIVLGGDLNLVSVSFVGNNDLLHDNSKYVSGGTTPILAPQISTSPLKAEAVCYSWNKTIQFRANFETSATVQAAGTDVRVKAIATQISGGHTYTYIFKGIVASTGGTLTMTANRTVPELMSKTTLNITWQYCNASDPSRVYKTFAITSNPFYVTAGKPWGTNATVTRVGYVAAIGETCGANPSEEKIVRTLWNALPNYLTAFGGDKTPDNHWAILDGARGECKDIVGLQYDEVRTIGLHPRDGIIYVYPTSLPDSAGQYAKETNTPFDYEMRDCDTGSNDHLDDSHTSQPVFMHLPYSDPKKEVLQYCEVDSHTHGVLLNFFEATYIYIPPSGGSLEYYPGFCQSKSVPFYNLTDVLVKGSGAVASVWTYHWHDNEPDRGICQYGVPGPAADVHQYVPGEVILPTP